VRITMTAGPSSELIGAVVDGSLDIALTSAVTPPPDPRLVFYPLAPHEPLVAIAPAGTSTTVPGSATLSELATSGPFIEFHAGSQLRTTVDALFRDAGLHREIIFELGQIGDVARCAAQGLGTAVVPRAFTAGLDLADSVMLEIEDRPTLTVGAYIRRSDRAPLVRAVLDVFASPSIDDA
jgi:DNA-binding transcriptional LysR family regulator